MDSFSIDTPDIRGLLNHLKEIEPKLATNLRRELRRSGDRIITEQRAKLNQLPSGSSGEHSTGLRDAISAGLRTRVTTGKNRQGIDIKTTGPRRDGYNLARMWQARVFRHPVFGHPDTWVDQPGQPYFFEPATDELRDLMRTRIQNAIEEALASA